MISLRIAFASSRILASSTSMPHLLDRKLAEPTHGVCNIAPRRQEGADALGARGNMLKLRSIGLSDYSVLEGRQRIGRIRLASERMPSVWLWNVTVVPSGRFLKSRFGPKLSPCVAAPRLMELSAYACLGFVVPE